MQPDIIKIERIMLRELQRTGCYDKDYSYIFGEIRIQECLMIL